MTSVPSNIVNYKHKTRVSRHSANAGFSLVEMLVVIAVIAILTSILLAAFYQAKESGRVTNSMSNMHAIYVGMERYYQDHSQTYPPVLFAYADGTHNMSTISNNQSALQGLYPVYVQDPNTFIDPNNDNRDPSSTANVHVNVNTVASMDISTATLSVNTNPLFGTFFLADSYDISPRITGRSAVDTTVMVPRYQRQWTSIVPTSTYTPATFGATPVGTELTYDQYYRQMKFPASTGETYVTASTYHVRSRNSVLVLFKDGHTTSWDASKFLAAQNGVDASDISVDSNGVSKAKFWTLTPTGQFQ